MKFGKTAQLILAIGIFAIGAIFLYRMNLGRQADKEQMNTQLTTAQTLVPKLTTERGELEAQLSQLRTELDIANASITENKAKFPSSVDSIQYDELLFKMAQDRSLEVMTLITSEPSDNRMEEVTYSVTSLNLEVRGEVADMLDFISALATGEEFTTATVELVDIRVPEPLTRAEKEGLTAEEAEEKELPSATVNIAIYSYKGG